MVALQSWNLVVTKQLSEHKGEDSWNFSPLISESKHSKISALMQPYDSSAEAKPPIR